jgi:dTDP-4-dehydrorhamnose 3,5-epimerase
VNRFAITETPLAGLKVIERQRLGDRRGFLSRLFCTQEMAGAGWTRPVVQINQTATFKKGTIRGMHYQLPPHAEMKLVSCLHGEIWDVAVDIRPASPTYLNWHGVCLSADNCLALLIPEGFAHGFQSLTEDVELLYCHSAAYHAEAERGLNPRDPELAISWPLSMAEISDRDMSHPCIDANFTGVRP